MGQAKWFEKLNGAVIKQPDDDFQTKLNDAASNNDPLWITSGTHTVSSKITYTTADDVVIVASPSAIIQNNGFDDTLLEIDGASSVHLQGGQWDFNESSRTQASVDGEIEIVNVTGVQVRDLRIRNNIQFGLFGNAVQDVTINGVEVRSSASIAGTDGIHINAEDGLCEGIVVSNCYTDTHDDGIGFVSFSDPIRDVAISNCVIDNEGGRAVVLEVDDSASDAARIQDFDVDVVVEQTNDMAIRVKNLKDNTFKIQNVTVNAVIRNPGGIGAEFKDVEGLSADIRVRGSSDRGIEAGRCEDFNLKANVKDAPGDLVNLTNCSTGTVQAVGSVQSGNAGVVLAFCDDVSVEANIDGGGDAKGVNLFKSSEVSIMGSHLSNWEDGIFAKGDSTDKSTGVRVVGCLVDSVTTGINTNNNSGEWTVTSNDLRGASTATSLSTTEGANITANNNT